MRIGLALSLLLATAASAPPPIPSESSEIVVQGTREREKQIQRFIRSLTPSAIHGQLSRFETKVCPLVVGLTKEQNVIVAARMRRVADAAGIPVAPADCRANAILIVTNDKSALLARLLQKRPYMFPDSWSMSRIHDLERDPSPVAAWAIEGVTSADGANLNYHNEVPLNRTFRPGSRLTASARPYFAAAVVILQADALDGLTTTQIADYAAMRTFVSTDPKRLNSATPGTILALLDTPMGQPVPITLTPWDLSFLTAYYASAKNTYVEYQRSQMKGLMRRDLDGRNDPRP